MPRHGPWHRLLPRLTLPVGSPWPAHPARSGRVKVNQDELCSCSFPEKIITAKKPNQRPAAFPAGAATPSPTRPCFHASPVPRCPGTRERGVAGLESFKAAFIVPSLPSNPLPSPPRSLVNPTPLGA
ncbi:hypothetical protein E2C01_062922 [Portunus trituberculatus]|uniref:Uncharacterized protein n=1 Tax=Portunus trituberculatus TaxID=210409 RepID=A0A5B7HFD5_PORTR|nr:hypothetical protein [Portunus trituberculatus]